MFPPWRLRSTGLSIPSTASRATKSPFSKRPWKRKQPAGKLPTTQRLRDNQVDRLHAAMLLQASARTNALRGLLKPEQGRSPDFLRLANALLALYFKEFEEKRLLEAMLLAVPK